MSFIGDNIKRRLHDEGTIGVRVNIGELLGVHTSEVTAARYMTAVSPTILMER